MADRADESSQREPKPDWSTIPPALIGKIEDHFKSRICAAETVWGGFTPSATFKLSFANQAPVFMKASHAGLNEEVGQRAFASELRHFRKHSALRQLAPQFHGSVKVPGWEAMLFAFIEDREALPPWSPAKLSAVIAKLCQLHEISRLADVPHAFQCEFTSGMYQGQEGWGSLLSAPDGFVGLLDDATAARTWLSTHGARLTEIEVGASSLNWTESLTHQDLRSDNIVYSRQLGPLFVDWPYLTVGPRLMDIAFAAPSIEAEGGPTCAQTVELYQKISKVRFSVEEIRTAAVIVSGFFATRAFLDPIPGLPRVRWIQKRQLFPALRWMNQVLDVPGTY